MGSEWSVAAFCRSDGIGYHPEHKRALQGLTEALQGVPDADDGRVEEFPLAHFLMLLPLIPKAVVLTRDEMFGRMGT